MRQPDDEAILIDVLYCARRVADRAARLTRDDYEDDEDLQLALARLVQNVGEAANQFSQRFRASHPEVPWSEIIGMRHRLVHDYLHVNIDIVWVTAFDDVPAFIAQLEYILRTTYPTLEEDEALT